MAYSWRMHQSYACRLICCLFVWIDIFREGWVSIPVGFSFNSLPVLVKKLPGRRICGSFFLSLSFFCSQVVIKKSSNDNFFCSKWWFFHSNYILFKTLLLERKKIVKKWLFNDDLSARKQEREEKRNRNSTPR